MKKIFLLSLVTSIALICACQKRDAAAQQDATQPKTELAAPEEALTKRVNSLEEKVNSLDQRIKELAAKGNTAAHVPAIPTDAQGQSSDAAQIQAEKERMIQQLSAMISERSHAAVADPAKQQRSAQRQLGPEDLQRQWQEKLNKAKMSGEAAFPAAEAASPSPSATPE